MVCGDLAPRIETSERRSLTSLTLPQRRRRPSSASSSAPDQAQRAPAVPGSTSLTFWTDRLSKRNPSRWQGYSISAHEPSTASGIRMRPNGPKTCRKRSTQGPRFSGGLPSSYPGPKIAGQKHHRREQHSNAPLDPILRACIVEQACRIYLDLLHLAMYM